MEEAGGYTTRSSLREDLCRLGIGDGDTVMVHAAMSRVGPILGGPDALIGALVDAAGPRGTIIAYTDWDAGYESFLDADGNVPPEWRDNVPPFAAKVSRTNRENGILPEFLRTTPRARRSGNPGASVAALGEHADWLVGDHPLDYGYGEGSPFAKLCAAGGKVLNLGAPRDTMTLLHHAEHLACVANKRIRRIKVPFAAENGTLWRRIEEFDTSRPIVPGLPDDYFAAIVTEFLAKGNGATGSIGNAAGILVGAADIVAFAVDWLEDRFGPRP